MLYHAFNKFTDITDIARWLRIFVRWDIMEIVYKNDHINLGNLFNEITKITW